ncbi:WD40 repeat-containing protein, putative [Bodo saltans]|uniref:WD40 repeat-containing protein, putative n=1 Tax=Bodo saltans TaxID=75058 RepID=A0A0S4JKW5_BODSA|nr:WD40 repeat-containing protein, putative [Bodo saltans]|eukprot:CUG90039.1 WD40 repeat-containing protein, putative [Bodo saltans]
MLNTSTTTTTPLTAQSLGSTTLLIDTTKQHTPPHQSPIDGTILSAALQPSSAIHFATYSPNGTLLATGSNDNVTQLWRVADGVCLATLAGHSGLVNSAAFSPDGTLLATGSADRMTKLWSVGDGVCIATFVGHSAAVSSVVFSPDGTLLASVGADGLWLVWDMKSDVPLCSRIVPAMEVEDVAFIKCDSQCCVLEYRCVGSPTKLSVKFEWNAPSNDGVAKVPIVSPHVCLADIAVGWKDIARDSLSVLRSCSWDGRSYVLRLYHSNVIRHIAHEVAVAPYLQHPNIVRVVAIVDSADGDGRTVGLLMELAEDSLSVVLASPLRPSIATLLRWLHEVAQAMEFAHECGVVHSDINPDKIMTVVSEQHVVAKVTDFGSASIRSTFGASATIARGTPMFCAPECTVGSTGPTKASDVFSFGMTMWYALVPQGTDLGLGRNDVQVALALLKGCRPSVTAIDPSYATLIERCWAAEPLARPSMGEVAEALRKLVACLVHPPPTPSSQLWATLLQSYNIEAEWKALHFHSQGKMHFADDLFLSDDIVDTSNRCYQLVAGMAGSLSRNVRRVVMLGTNARTTNSFVNLQERKFNNYSVNAVKNPNDAASAAGFQRLNQSSIPVVTAPGKPLPCARLLFGWYGTSPDKVTAVCRDGPSALRTLDSGYFGSGLYFALEAEYALRKSPPDPATGERAMILYVISLVEPKVITPEIDYRRVEDTSTPHLHGFSQYYSGNPTTGVALAHGYDSHFIPVKNYECTHPLTGLATTQDVGYQAVDESSGAAEAHEIVIGSRFRCFQ